jgi:hypothetical protein
VPVIGMWSDAQIAQVKELFGEHSDLYHLAVNGSGDLVPRMELLALPDDLSEGALIAELGTMGDESRLDSTKAQRLLERLIERRKIRNLVRELRQSPAFRRYVQEREHEPDRYR